MNLFPRGEPVRRHRRSKFERVAEETRSALTQVEDAADDDWKAEALEAIWRTCVRLPEFISDDIWRVGGLQSTREDRALGPILLHAKRLGWCHKTDRQRPSLRSHLSGKPVWRSLCHGDGPG